MIPALVHDGGSCVEGSQWRRDPSQEGAEQARFGPAIQVCGEHDFTLGQASIGRVSFAPTRYLLMALMPTLVRDEWYYMSGESEVPSCVHISLIAQTRGTRRVSRSILHRRTEANAGP